MSTTLIQEDGIQTAYLRMKSSIDGVAARYCCKYGGEFDEWQAEANLGYVCAFRTYKQDKGSLPAWILFCVRTSLADKARSVYKHSRRTISGESVAELLKLIKDERTSFNGVDLMDGLSQDAKTIINLLWHPTEQLQSLIKTGSNPCHTRVALRKHLTSLGWTGRKIKETFKEIAEALYA